MSAQENLWVLSVIKLPDVQCYVMHKNETTIMRDIQRSTSTEISSSDPDMV